MQSNAEMKFVVECKHFVNIHVTSLLSHFMKHFIDRDIAKTMKGEHGMWGCNNPNWN